jgi:putative endopeptidase
MRKLLNRTLATAIFAALSTTAIAASTAPAFDVKELDAKIAPCADFNGFVNAKWVAANPIPADRTRWGAFDQLREHSLQTQRGIVEAAALGANKAPAGSIQQKIGWFYRSGMAEGAIEKAGLAPVKPEIAKIEALKTPADIAAYINDASSRGQNGLFQIYTSPDFKNSKVQIAYVAQGGIGLPTSEYYSKPDYAELRSAYQAHVAKVLELAGDKADSAKKSAEQVLAFETRLAKASLVPVELRKPENQYHFVTLAEADALTPRFPWT